MTVSNVLDTALERGIEGVGDVRDHAGDDEGFLRA